MSSSCSSSKKWVVGYFKKENKYSVIPFNWIVNCGNICLSKWPNSGNVNILINEASEPGLDWPTFPVKMVSQVFNIFEDAKFKEKELFHASESESPVRKKRKKKVFYPHTEENDSASSSTHTTPIKVMKPANINSDTTSSKEQNQLLSSNFMSSALDTLYGIDYNIDDHNTEQELLTNEISPSTSSFLMSTSIIPEISNTTITENQCNMESNILIKLFENSISILAYMKRLDNKMDSIIQMNNNQIHSTINNDFENCFPFKSVEEVVEMENKLILDENKLTQLRLLLHRIGGTGLKNYIKRVLERLFTNQLSTKYSWTGFRENHALKHLKIISIMKDIAISTFSETEANFETHIKDWFRHGTQRYSREQQKGY